MGKKLSRGISAVVTTALGFGAAHTGQNLFKKVSGINYSANIQYIVDGALAGIAGLAQWGATADCKKKQKENKEEDED